MKKVSHYTIFFDWLFDGHIKSPLPNNPDFDLLKYNSPINETFLLKMFIQHGPLNYFLNEYNHLGIRYIDREELFFFIKECVMAFKIKRNQIHYTPYRRKTIIFNKLREKFPLYKDHEITLLSNAIDKFDSEKKLKIYTALGIEKPKKVSKKKKSTTPKKKSISAKQFIDDNFELYPVD